MDHSFWIGFGMFFFVGEEEPTLNETLSARKKNSHSSPYDAVKLIFE